MFLVDMADFYQIFLHIKQITRPFKSQPYIKNQEKSINTIDSIDIKFFQYLPSLIPMQGII